MNVKHATKFLVVAVCLFFAGRLVSDAYQYASSISMELNASKADLMLYAGAFLAALVSVFLKGFQHKNVISNMYWSTFVTSYFMAFMDVLLISWIVKSESWTIAFASGGGASIGMVSAMYVHNRFMSKSKSPEPSHEQA